GNQRTSGEKSRQEGGKIFGSGSRAPIVIAILVKNPAATQSGQIYFHDIGDYLTREEKLEKISDFGSIDGIEKTHGWQKITPDAYNDWLNQRDDSFYDFIEIGNKKDKDSKSLFSNYSRGLETNRDAWCYNYSKEELSQNIDKTLRFYNSEVDR
ncbi:type ISP restriction/modification enzyme, partial [Escherichia coli]